MSNTASSHFRRTQQWLCRAALPLLCFLATPALAAGETRVVVDSASFALDQDVYELDSRTTVTLPDDARRAIEAGLALRLDYEIEIQRVRRYVPDASVAELVQSYELNYHALSQRYLLRNLNTGEQQDVGTLAAALERLGEVRGLPVIDRSLLEKGVPYEARVRAVLDMSTAPDAFGWLLFWADDWSASSEWFTWSLRL
jgi:hypothetical protein